MAPILVSGSLLLAAAGPPPAAATPKVVATRGLPSSISSEYGEAVSLGDPSVAGPYVIPTRWGIEVRDAVIGGEAPIGSFRTSGSVGAVAVDGSTAYLFAGPRGIIAVDLADQANPVAIGARADLGDVTLGAASPSGYGLAASADTVLHFLGRSTPGELSLLTTLHFSDGRLIRGIRARADSFLVVSARPQPIPRLFLTLYRLPSGAAQPESLLEIPIPLQTPTGLAWRGDLAFVSVGNQGISVVNVRTGQLRSASVPGNRFVYSLAANDSTVVAVTQAQGFVRFRRGGALGDSLIDAVLGSLTLEPQHVAIQGGLAIVGSVDQVSVQEPDELGRSAIEFRNLDLSASPPEIGGTGRARRVAWNAGLAFVADYTGGFRVYRADGADTSLVGVLPLANSRVVDVALDVPRGRAYLASGSQGLQVVDISDPASPSLLATLSLFGLASAVAVVDSGLVVVGRRGGGSAGISFVDVSVPTSPSVRGQLGSAFAPEPRAIAIKDTIAFVADESVGLLSIRFGDPDAPALLGLASGGPARDLDLSGSSLLVATRSFGLQVVDVFDPAVPVLRSETPTPPLFGVARSGSSAVLFMGNAEAMVADVTDPFAPVLRGPIAVPGFARDGAWIGDTLLVAAGLALERFRVSPAPLAVPALTIEVDGATLLPRARISWSPVMLPGLVGLNLYRDRVLTPAGTTDPVGVRVHPALLPPTETEAEDEGLSAGATYRYRLEAFLSEGSSRKVAEGTVSISVGAAVGRPFPNPYRAAGGAVATLPFRVGAGGAGATVELTVYDVSGRLVRRLAQPAPAAGGFGAAAWDGRDQNGRRMSDGVYFLRLRGPGIDDAHQVILLR